MNRWCRSVSVFFLLTLFTFSLMAQQILPRGFSEGEEALMPSYMSNVISNNINRNAGPPADPIRSMAEWEELDGIAITWTAFPTILSQIVAVAQEEGKVYIVCGNEATVRSQLMANGVIPNDQVEYITAPFNSIWIRDYGPNSAYLNGVDSLVFVDWIYNRPRFQDDQVPAALASHLNVGLFETNTAPEDLVNTGGNYMADGMGQAFCSELVLDENGPQNTWGNSNHDEAAVDQIMNTYLGLEHYFKMPVLPFDAIHHIDMHMKLLDERTLLVGEYPEGIADGPQIEANIQLWIQEVESAFGHSFDIIRIPMPPDGNGRYPDNFGDYRTYANALFINKSIIVPTYETRYDTTALRIWEEAMPGYNIVGINCNAIIPLSGALHCITKEIGVRDPLLIAHDRLADISPGNEDDYEVVAHIEHRSGIESAKIYYATDSDGPFLEADMIQVDDVLWRGFIPVQEARQYVYYYIEAQAVNGKIQQRPLVAPEGTFSFFVKGGLTDIQEVQNDITNSQLLPNPANESTMWSASFEEATTLSFTVIDMFGRENVLSKHQEFSVGKGQFAFDTSNWAPGVYLLIIQSENGGRVVERLLVNH